VTRISIIVQCSPLVGWTGYVGQYHTIPLYACAFVFILTFCFAVSLASLRERALTPQADRLQKKALFISIAAFLGTVFFVRDHRPSPRACSSADHRHCLDESHGSIRLRHSRLWLRVRLAATDPNLGPEHHLLTGREASRCYCSGQLAR